jgi:flagella basal body P-ring formation protein FlgA
MTTTFGKKLITICVFVFIIGCNVLSTGVHLKAQSVVSDHLIQMAEESLGAQYDANIFEFKLGEKWIPETLKTLGKDEIVEVRLNGPLRKFSNFRVSYIEAARGTMQHRFVQLEVTGRIKTYTTLAKLTQGKKLTKDRIHPFWIPFDANYKQFVLDEQDLLGNEANRLLIPGKPIKINEVKIPSILEAGAEVSLLFKNGALVLSLQCESLDDAALGQKVPIYCKDQRTKYVGIVESATVASWSKTL